MSHLPENMADWPKDPLELLGVNSPTDEKSLKRAYMRLIRQFRPEHAPEEFCRIREAYELARALAPMGFGECHNQPPQSRELASEDFDTSTSAHAEMVELAGPDLWSMFRDGDAWNARRQMESLHELNPLDVQVMAKLYWMRKLDPEDNSQSIIRWLIGVAQKSGFFGQAWFLLMNELKANPALALGDDVTRLVAIAPDISYLMQLLEIRWQEAIRCERFTLLRDDLANMEDRLSFQDETTWAEVMLRVGRMLLTCSTDDVLLEEQCIALCRLQNEGILPPHLSSSLKHVLALRELKKQQPNVVERLMPIFVACELPSADTFQWTQLDDWSHHPCDALSELELLASDSPFVFQSLWNALKHALDDLPDSQQYGLEPVVQEFVRDLASLSMGADTAIAAVFRLRVLKFCVRENICVSHLSALLGEVENSSKGISRLAVRLLYDQPLACLCDALRLHGHTGVGTELV